MVVLEVLLISSLVFGGGYFTRLFTEPEIVCKEIVFEVPIEVRAKKEASICFEGYEANNLKECMVGYPRMVMPEGDGINLIETCKKRGVYLDRAGDLIVEYNNNKSIER